MYIVRSYRRYFVPLYHYIISTPIYLSTYSLTSFVLVIEGLDKVSIVHKNILLWV